MPDSTTPPGYSDSGLVDRRVLQAERDAARAERRVILAQQETATTRLQVAKLQAERADEAHRIVLLQDQIQKIHASTSWRISRPVRVLSNLAQRWRVRLGIAPPPPESVNAAPTPATSHPASPREQAILRRLQGKP